MKRKQHFRRLNLCLFLKNNKGYLAMMLVEYSAISVEAANSRFPRHVSVQTNDKIPLGSSQGTIECIIVARGKQGALGQELKLHMHL